MATTPELISFVRAQVASGTSGETLRRLLSTQGWVAEDIDAALRSAGVSEAGVGAPEPAAEPPPVAAPRASHAVVKVVGVAVGVLAVLGLLALTAYAYVEKLGPFNRPPYTEATLLGGLLRASAGVSSFSFTASTSLRVVPRESGDLAFVATTSADVAAAYARDYERVQDLSQLLSFLQIAVSHYDQPLSTLTQGSAAKVFKLSARAVEDPVTEQPYAFAGTSGGKNFSLTVNFETPQAVQAIEESPFFSASTTAVNNLSVTFTRGSSWLFSVQQAPPEPFIMRLQDAVGTLPADTEGTLSLKGAFDTLSATSAREMSFMFSGHASSSSVLAGATLLQKGTQYYARLDALPPQLTAYVPIPIGAWIDLTGTFSTSTVSEIFGNVGSASPQMMTSRLASTTEVEAYRAYSTDALAALRAANLIAFVRPPYSEKVQGVSLYRYDLTLRKDAVVALADQLFAIAQKDLSLSSAEVAQAKQQLAYLHSPEFAVAFSYLQDHWTTTLWVDARGVPRMFDSTLTVIPSGLSTTLSGKKVILETHLENAEINAHPVIDAPATSTPLKNIIAHAERAGAESPVGGESAAADAYLNTIQTSGEIYYATENSYGTDGVGCLRTGNFFGGDSTTRAAIQGLQRLSSVTNVYCVVGKKGQSNAAEVRFADGSYACVDSTGVRKKTTVALGQNSVCP